MRTFYGNMGNVTLLTVKQFKLFNDMPGSLLICEFDWEFNPDPELGVIDTHQTNLEDSLKTRRLASFDIDITIRNRQPREEFGVPGTVDVKEELSRRLKKSAFEEEEILMLRLDLGNFAPLNEHYDPNGNDFGKTRYALRLSFTNKSPIPSRDKWNDYYQPMLEGMNWEKETTWFNRKLRDPSSNEWAFHTRQR